MVYLLKIVIFHGYVSHNQMVPYLANLPGPPINWTWPHGCSAGVLRIALPETGVLMHLWQGTCFFAFVYPLVNIQKAMENHLLECEFSHIKWWFSSSFFVRLPGRVPGKVNHGMISTNSFVLWVCPKKASSVGWKWWTAKWHDDPEHIVSLFLCSGLTTSNPKQEKHMPILVHWSSRQREPLGFN